MRYLILISLLSNLLFSLVLECNTKKKVYTATNAMTEVCELSDTKVEVYLSTVGSNYHTCNLMGLAEKKEDVFVLKENECIVHLKFTNDTLDLSFKSDCTKSCGARAWWIQGKQNLISNK